VLPENMAQIEASWPDLRVMSQGNGFEQMPRKIAVCAARVPIKINIHSAL